MSQRKYTYIKTLEPEIVEMKESGKTKREIAEHFGLTIEQVSIFYADSILRDNAVNVKKRKFIR